MTTTLIFDCFGVLCVGARSYAISQCSVDKRQQLDDLFNQADYGYITTAQFMHQGSQLLNMTDQAFDSMMHRRYVLDDAMLTMVRRLRGSYTIALLSNANDTIIEELFPPTLRDELFDDVVVSSSVGLIKPDPQLFEYAAHRLNVLPEECVMIDDIESNITGAIRVGMKGVVFTDQSQCEQALQELDVYA